MFMECHFCGKLEIGLIRHVVKYLIGLYRINISQIVLNGFVQIYLPEENNNKQTSFTH